MNNKIYLQKLKRKDKVKSSKFKLFKVKDYTIKTVKDKNNNTVIL